jgi:hypothetical protein
VFQNILIKSEFMRQDKDPQHTMLRENKEHFTPSCFTQPLAVFILLHQRAHWLCAEAASFPPACVPTYLFLAQTMIGPIFLTTNMWLTVYKRRQKRYHHMFEDAISYGFYRAYQGGKRCARAIRSTTFVPGKFSSGRPQLF